MIRRILIPALGLVVAGGALAFAFAGSSLFPGGGAGADTGGSPSDNSALAAVQCYLGTWELDSAYTFENADFSPGGSMEEMPIDFVMASGSAFLTFGSEGDFTYTFDNWSSTFQSDSGPISTEVLLNLHGDVWGRYAEADDNALTLFMSGNDVPEPNITSSMVIMVGGQPIDGPLDLESLFGPQTSLLDYRCDGKYLYVDGESAGGAFRNARYTRVGTRTAR